MTNPDEGQFSLLNGSLLGQALCVDGGGHVVPYELWLDSPSSFSDLFYVKGMAAAAYMLNLEEELAESMQWFKQIDKDVVLSDQQPLDPGYHMGLSIIDFLGA